MIFYCIFELTEAFTTRLHQKNVQKPSKKAKNTAAGTNILPQKAKVLLFPPPCLRKLAFYTWVPSLLTAYNKYILGSLLAPQHLYGSHCLHQLPLGPETEARLSIQQPDGQDLL